MQNLPANTPDKKDELAVPMIKQPSLFEQMNTGASKLDLIRNNANLSIQKAADSSIPTLGHLKKEFSAEQIEKCVGILVADLSESFDYDLKEKQIEEIAVTICSGINLNLKLETIFLACNQIKQQANYGKLNVNKVLNTIRTLFDEQLEVIQQNNQNQHYQLKEPRQSMATNETFRDSMHKAKVLYQSGKLNNQTQAKQTDEK